MTKKSLKFKVWWQKKYLKTEYLRISFLSNLQYQDESQQKVREFDEYIKQEEEDADMEIHEIRIKYEQNLKEEKKANTRLKVELDTTTKQVTIMNQFWLPHFKYTMYKQWQINWIEVYLYNAFS